MKKKFFLFIFFLTPLYAKNNQLGEIPINSSDNPESKVLSSLAVKKSEKELDPIKKLKDKQSQDNGTINDLKKSSEKLHKEKALVFEKTDKKTVSEKLLNKQTNKKASSTSRQIAVNNKITEKTITYEKHWAKPFPSDFKATINDQDYLSLKNGKLQLHAQKFSTLGNKIKVTYEWALKKFGKLWHQEKREVEFEIPPTLEELNIKFCWDNDYRINIDDAKMILPTTIEMSNG